MANRGPYVVVAAPGVEILALAPGEAYQVTTGTSVAAAHISGVAALLLSANRRSSPRKFARYSTAKPFEFAGHADFGAGLANAYQAVISLNPKPLAKDDSEQAKPDRRPVAGAALFHRSRRCRRNGAFRCVVRRGPSLPGLSRLKTAARGAEPRRLARRAFTKNGRRFCVRTHAPRLNRRAF